MCFINKVVVSTVLSLGGFSRLNLIYGVLPLSSHRDYFWSSTLPAAEDTGTLKADGSIARTCWWCCRGSGGGQTASNLPWGVCWARSKAEWRVPMFFFVWQLAASAPSVWHDRTGLRAAVCNGLLCSRARACPNSTHRRWLHWLPAEFPRSLSHCVKIKE